MDESAPAGRCYSGLNLIHCEVRKGREKDKKDKDVRM
jgi:hypothetical protein